MPLTQGQINDAVMRLLDGDSDALQMIREGVANGEITVQAGETGLHLRAAPTSSPLSRALEQLHVEAGQPAFAEIAQVVGVSEATISRLFAAQRVSGWPTVRLVVECLGGKAADYRDLWNEAKRR